MGNNFQVVGIFELQSAMPHILTANKSNALTINEWNIDTASDKRPFLSWKKKQDHGNSPETIIISVLVAE